MAPWMRVRAAITQRLPWAPSTCIRQLVVVHSFCSRNQLTSSVLHRHCAQIHISLRRCDMYIVENKINLLTDLVPHFYHFLLTSIFSFMPNLSFWKSGSSYFGLQCCEMHGTGIIILLLVLFNLSRVPL